jgi:two-component system sensor histidine kinase YesM
MRIRMFVSPYKIASGEHVNFFSIEDITGMDWYKDVLGKKGAVYWTGIYSETFIDSNAQNIVSCARVLKHTYNYNDNNGVLLVDINESSIYSLLSTINIKKGNVFIIDSAGKAISCKDKSQLGKEIVSSAELADINSNTSGVTSMTKGKEKINVIYQAIMPTGWKLVAEVGRDEIVRTNTVFNNISVFVFIIVMFIIVVFGVFLIAMHAMDEMNRQVKKLAGDIEKEGVDVIDASGKSNYVSGDFIKLETYVYGMIGKVKNLMEDSYQSRIREREAQIKALQAQINPHFLYNTLDTINWMAVKIDAEEISFMVNSLAKYFRLSLSKGKSVVSIHDELELVRVYLSIQQTRYKGAIQFRFDIDEETENCKIQKLTLQPIVENAVLHGVQKNRDRRGEVVIESKKYEKEIVISITDNGGGMDQETMEHVLCCQPETGEGHYGLYNVNERIKLFFGEEYGIRLYSQVGEGTRVEVHISILESGQALSDK